LTVGDLDRLDGGRLDGLDIAHRELTESRLD